MAFLHERRSACAGATSRPSRAGSVSAIPRVRSTGSAPVPTLGLRDDAASLDLWTYVLVMRKFDNYRTMTRTGHRTPLLLAAAGAWSVLLALPAARRARSGRGASGPGGAGEPQGGEGRRARPERRRAARPRPRRAESARAGRRATAPRRRRSPAPRVAGAGQRIATAVAAANAVALWPDGNEAVRGERAQRGTADRRPLAVEGLLEDVRYERRAPVAAAAAANASGKACATGRSRAPVPPAAAPSPTTRRSPRRSR